jgi:hypothetical protein
MLEKIVKQGQRGRKRRNPQDLGANVFWENRYRTATRDDAKKIIPPSPDPTTVLLHQFFERYAHLFLNDTRIVDVAANAKQLRALIAFSSETSKPAGPTSAYRWGDCNRFHIRDSGRASKQANVRREGGFESRFALLPLQTLDQGRFFTAYIGASSSVQIDIEAIPRPT